MPRTTEENQENFNKRGGGGNNSCNSEAAAEFQFLSIQKIPKMEWRYRRVASLEGQTLDPVRWKDVLSLRDWKHRTYSGGVEPQCARVCRVLGRNSWRRVRVRTCVHAPRLDRCSLFSASLPLGNR